MKKFRIIAAAVVLLMCASALCSCQLSKLIKKDNETTANAETTATDTASVETTVEAMDFSGMDLSGYVKLGAYKGVGVTVTVPELTDEDFTKGINSLLDENSYYTRITDRAAVSGDTLNIDFVGYMDGVQFENGSADNQTIELSSSSGYIDGFAEGLIGAMPGSTVKLELTFPTNYYEDMAGKPVTFDVKVNYIHGERVVPELNDEFVKTYTSGDYTTVEAFNTYFREVLIDGLTEEAENEALTVMWGNIIENAEIVSYPDQQVQYYYNVQKAQYEAYAANNSVDYATILAYFGVTEESMMESAKNYTAEDLVFYAIVKAEGFEITDSEYAAGAAKYAAEAEATVEAIEAYYGKDYIVECLLWDETLSQLFEWAVVTRN